VGVAPAAAAAGSWQLGDLHPAHLDENVAAGALHLSPAEMTKLMR